MADLISITRVNGVAIHCRSGHSGCIAMTRMGCLP
jgi:hypothetical protein